jgi:hypothetical protein
MATEQGNQTSRQAQYLKGTGLYCRGGKHEFIASEAMPSPVADKVLFPCHNCDYNDQRKNPEFNSKDPAVIRHNNYERRRAHDLSGWGGGRLRYTPT